MAATPNFFVWLHHWLRACGICTTFISILQHLWLTLAISAVMDWFFKGGYSEYSRLSHPVYLFFRWFECLALIFTARLASLCLDSLE